MCSCSQVYGCSRISADSVFLYTIYNIHPHFILRAAGVLDAVFTSDSTKPYRCECSGKQYPNESSSFSRKRSKKHKSLQKKRISAKRSHGVWGWPQKNWRILAWDEGFN
jgi:hypothetical protein